MIKFWNLRYYQKSTAFFFSFQQLHPGTSRKSELPWLWCHPGWIRIWQNCLNAFKSLRLSTISVHIRPLLSLTETLFYSRSNKDMRTEEKTQDSTGNMPCYWKCCQGLNWLNVFMGLRTKEKFIAVSLCPS